MSSVIETLGDLWITPLSDRQQKILALISIIHTSFIALHCLLLHHYLSGGKKSF
jgi:hypothetical protein